MAAAVTDLSFGDLLAEIPPGAWVAISEEKHAVLSYGIDPQEVIREAKEKGEDLPLIVRKPDQSTVLFF